MLKARPPRVVLPIRDKPNPYRSRVQLAPWLLGAALIAFVFASPALGYVHTRAPGSPVQARWQRPEVELVWSSADLPKGVSAIRVREALGFAASAWSRATVKCTSMKVSVKERSKPLYGGVEDGASSVVFHERRFCKKGIDRPGYCYDRRIAAMTTLHFSDDRRFIVEADIELNAVDFDFGDDSGGSSKIKVDLAQVFLHEVGHVVGFDHVCTLKSKPWLRDHQRRPVPICNSASRAIRRSAMVPSFDEADGAKHFKRRPLRSISPLDRAGLCAVYPY